MTEKCDCHSPSVDLYYNNTKDDNVEEQIESIHFANQFTFPQNFVVTRKTLSLYMVD